MSRILLVIPCFRERERLPAFLDELIRHVENAGLAVAIRVVDDGSGPEHAEWIRQHIEHVRASHPCLLPALLAPQNLGKGGAIYLGWTQRDGYDWLAFADADGATAAPEILRMFQLVLAAPDAADAFFASRVKMLGRTVQRRLSRHLTGRVFATAASVLLDLPIYDSQCGFKVLRRSAYETVTTHLREMRFCFDVDLLLQLRLHGKRVVEVPVDWEDKDGSKVSLWRDSLAMFRSLLKLRKVVRQSRR